MNIEKRDDALIALDESSLEAVAGGRIDVDVDIEVELEIELEQKNKIVFAGNEITSGGEFTFYVEQSNSTGGGAAA